MRHFSIPIFSLCFRVHSTDLSWLQNKHLKTVATVGRFFFNFFWEVLRRPITRQQRAKNSKLHTGEQTIKILFFLYALSLLAVYKNLLARIPIVATS